MFEYAEPVTICDQLIRLRFVPFKHEVPRETFNVTFDGLIENLSFRPVKHQIISYLLMDNRLRVFCSIGSHT